MYITLSHIQKTENVRERKGDINMEQFNHNTNMERFSLQIVKLKP